MSLADELRSELGIDELNDKLDRILERLDRIDHAKPFYTVAEAARYIGKRKAEVEKLISVGVLWTVQGLDSSYRLIPHAALESLQERPPLVEAVAS